MIKTEQVTPRITIVDSPRPKKSSGPSWTPNVGEGLGGNGDGEADGRRVGVYEGWGVGVMLGVKTLPAAWVCFAQTVLEAR